ncbi:unnamed protein product [Trichogramma brassicae]|uniref:CCHC-type domain-containing protein n=1 Tax=Trichogramma brassicae TaxID=86971 RepID=A0A6H5HZG2_9HYME|nr:unnamed protein product [Trichogramma brassicae]
MSENGQYQRRNLRRHNVGVRNNTEQERELSPVLSSTLSTLSWDYDEYRGPDGRQFPEEDDEQLLARMARMPRVRQRGSRGFSEPTRREEEFQEGDGVVPAVFSACGDLNRSPEGSSERSNRHGNECMSCMSSHSRGNATHTVYQSCKSSMYYCGEAQTQQNRRRNYETYEEPMCANNGVYTQQNSRSPCEMHQQRNANENVNMMDMMKLLMSYEERREERLREQEKHYERLVSQFMQSPNPTSSAPTSTSTAYHIVPDLSKDIRTFNGEESNAMAKEWLRGITSRQKLHHWPDSYAFETARSHLRGGARNWLERKPHVNDWPTFQAAFKKTFIGVDSLSEAWERMSSRVQQKNEKLSTYFHEKMKLCSQVKMNFADAREQIIIGLWSKELRNIVASRQHSDDDDLLHDLHAQQRIISQSYAKRSSYSTKSESSSTATVTPDSKKFSKAADNNNSSDSSDNITRTKAAARKAPPRNEKGEPKCYACNFYGHISKDCPTKNENRNTQSTSSKPTPSAQTKEDRIVAKIDSATADAALKYFKDAELDGQNIRAFIDQGSSDCIIKASSALQLGLRLIKDNLKLRCYGPKEHQINTIGFVNCSLSIDGVKADKVPVRVVPDDFQPMPLLVGRSYTELPFIKFSKDKDTFKFMYDLDQLSQEETTSYDTLQVKENNHLLPNSVNFVCINDAERNVSLPVFNFSEKPVMLLEGENFPDRGELCEAPPLLSTKKQAITEADVVIGENQPTEAKRELIKLLNEYRDTIAMSIEELGHTSLIEMDIKELPGSKPVNRKPYPASNAERERIKAIVSEWKRLGICTETDSPYASPVLIFKKKNEDRLVVDYRLLNQQTEKRSFPLPNIEDHLAQLRSENKLFIVLDLAHGYLQVPLAKEAQEKTAFVTPDETGLMRTLTVQEESYTPPEELHEGVRESIVKEQAKYKENYDKKRYSTTFYNIGDIVYMQANPVATGESTKLQQKFKGPFIIYKILPGDTYGITDLNPAQKGSRYASTAHVSQLKQWKPCAEDDPESEDNLTDEEMNSDESLSSKIKKISNSDEEDKKSRPMRRKKFSSTLSRFYFKLIKLFFII